ncbi:MAG: DUF1501 domain-containing protein [Lacunisphaera sp.]
MTTRRQFIGQATCAGFSLAGVLSTMGTLRLFNASLSAQTVPDGDFKALVCLFLYGGNDGNNVLIPRDTAGYAAYAQARGVLAVPSTNLLGLTLPAGDGRSFGLHPSLPRLAGLFNGGKAAMVANVGTLVGPLTKTQYLKGGKAVPPYLFSHSDQQLQWQTSVPDSPAKVGWGGRLADLTQALNAGSQISMNITLAGANYFQVGNEVFQYPMNSSGSVGLSQFTSTSTPTKQQYAAVRDVIGHSYGHLFEQEYVNVMGRAVSTDTLLKSILATVPLYPEKFTASTGTNGQLTQLASQLRMILRMIAAQKALGMKRQIYFAAIGGFDTHSNQLTEQAQLLSMLDNGLADFNQGIADLGMATNVTTFTASDFSRTYGTNGEGTDHAWGNHHFVMGGAVRGGQIYGDMPVLQIGGPNDTGSRGSWIPGVSTDEYSATLAKWFGVSPGNMAMVLPNIGRFARPDLGFMG